MISVCFALRSDVSELKADFQTNAEGDFVQSNPYPSSDFSRYLQGTKLD